MGDTGTLFDYGPDFETKVLSLLLKDVTFYKYYHGILYPKYFNNEYIAWIVEKKEELYSSQIGTDKRFPPSLNVIETEIRKVAIEGKNLIDTFNDTQRGEALRQKAYFIKKEFDKAVSFDNQQDLNHAKEKVLEFCNVKELAKGLREAAQALKDGRLDEVSEIVKKANRKVTRTYESYDYRASVEDRYRPDARLTISTPYEELNNVLEGGGFSEGELACMLAPRKGGKTWSMLAFVGHVLTQLNGDVIYFTNETTNHQLSRRLDGYLSGINYRDLTLDNINVLKEALKKYPANFKVQYIPPGSSNYDHIRNYIDTFIEIENINPKLIVIDDPRNITVSGKFERNDLALASRYEQCKMIAHEYKVPVLVPVQANKQAEKVDVIKNEHIGDSYAILGVCDIMLSWSRKDVFAVTSSRIGGEGSMWKLKFDADTGHHKIIEPYVEEDGLDIDSLANNFFNPNKKDDNFVNSFF